MFTKRNILDHFYEALRIIKIIETEKRVVVARGREEEGKGS